MVSLDCQSFCTGTSGIPAYSDTSYSDTGYSDTGYSDIGYSDTIFAFSFKRLKITGYRNTPLIVTLLAASKGVTQTWQPCNNYPSVQKFIELI